MKPQTREEVRTMSNKKEKGVRDPNIFPHDPAYNWNADFFGPLYIPEAGETIEINLEVLPLYKRVITEYEGNTLQVKGNQIRKAQEPLHLWLPIFYYFLF